MLGVPSSNFAELLTKLENLWATLEHEACSGLSALVLVSAREGRTTAPDRLVANL